MPYTPILDLAQLLNSTLYLIEHTEYPHKGHPALEHVKSALRDALEAIHEVEPLQAEVTGQSIPADSPKANRTAPSEPTPIDSARRNKRP